MSYFTTIAILPLDVSSITDQLEEMLAPYDENSEVREYDRECYCINRTASDFGFEKALELMGFGNFDEYRKRYWDIPEAYRPSWKKWLSPFEAIENKATRSHEAYNKPDPKCDECRGTGAYKSTYNPNSKWDWWVIGGRWNGELIGKARDDGDGGFNFGDEFHSLRENSCKVQDIADGFIPFAVITPDGEWHEKGEMGWWGMASNKKKESLWKKEVEAIFKQYPDHIAVLLDCHI